MSTIPECREIPLAKNAGVSLVDRADFDLVAHLSWHKTSQGYARAPARTGRGKMVLMHRLILAAAPKTQIDHANGNRLDNRRCNLRFCDPSQGSCNRRNKRPWGFIGVVPEQKSPGWVAQIEVHGKIFRRYAFPTPEAAAAARDEMAIEHHGEFAVLNFPRASGA